MAFVPDPPPARGFVPDPTFEEAGLSARARVAKLARRQFEPIESAIQNILPAQSDPALAGLRAAVRTMLPVPSPDVAETIVETYLPATPLEIGLGMVPFLGALGRGIAHLARPAAQASEGLEAIAEASGAASRARPPTLLEAVESATRRLEELKIGAPPPRPPLGLSAAPSGPLPKYAGNLNLERLNTTDDVKRWFLDIAEAQKPTLEAARGKQSLAETLTQGRKLADEVGLDVGRLRITPGQETAEITAVRIANVRAAEHALEQAQAFTAGTGSFESATITLRRAIEIQAVTTGRSAEAGRALGAHRLVVGGDRARAIEAVVKALGGREVTEDALRKLATVTDVASANKFLRGLYVPTLEDKVHFAWLNAILSNPATQVSNIIGNLSALFLRPLAERPTAAAIELVRAGWTGGPRTRLLGEAVADLYGITSSLRLAGRDFWETFRTGLGQIARTKLDVIPRARQPLAGAAGEAVSLPMRFLAAADDFFKALARSGEASALAYRTVAPRARSLTELRDGILRDLSEMTPDKLARLDREAAYRTFTSDPGQIGRLGLAIRELEVIGLHPLRFVLPFVSTPVNIFKFGLERTPLQVARLAALKLRGRAPSGGDLSEELAKGVLGSFAAATAALGVAEGRLTGGGPVDPARRQVLRSAGWQPYSLRLGDRWVSYSRLEPLASMIGWVADAGELFSIIEWEDAASKIGLAFSRGVLDKTWLKSFSDMNRALADPERFGQVFLQRTIGGFVPNIVAAAERGRAGVIPRPRTLGQALRGRLPGGIDQVPVLRDIWGQPVLLQPADSAALRLGQSLFNPVYVQRISQDPATLELVRLGIGMGSPRRQVGEFKLSDADYERYVEASGDLAKRYVDRIIHARVYTDWTDEAKERQLRHAFSLARERAAKLMFSRDMAQARREKRSGS